MIHIMCFDNLPKNFEKDTSDFVLLISVNAKQAVFRDHKRSDATDIMHLIHRFNEFKCFKENLEYFAPKSNDIDLYIKFGGFCFMRKGIEEVYQCSKSVLETLFKYDCVIDEFENNELLDKGSYANAYDKMIFRKMIREKDDSLLTYKLNKKYNSIFKDYIKEADKMTIAEFKKSDFCEKQDLIPTTVAGYEDYIKNLKAQPQK